MASFNLYANAPTESEINKRVGMLICQLMAQHQIKGEDLAKKVGLAVPTISRIRKGKQRLYKKNFEKIREALCTNDFERKQFEAVYRTGNFDLSDTEGLPESEIDEATRLMVERHLSERARPMHRRIAVRQAIEAANLDYIQDYAVGPIHVDFLVTTQYEEYDSSLGFNTPTPRQLGIFLAETDQPDLFEGIARCLREYIFLDEVIFVLSQSHEERRRGPKKKKTPERAFHDAVAIEQLRQDLMKIERDSCPPAITIESEAYEQRCHIEEALEPTLKQQNITTETKHDYLIARRPDKQLAAIVTTKEYSLGIAKELERAEQIRKQLKCVQVAIIIPDDWGLKQATYDEGVSILSLSSLNKTSLGL